TNMMKLVVEIECFGMSVDEFDKETGSSDGLQPKQADLSYVHALNEPYLREIHVVLNNSEYFFGLVTLFSLMEGQMSGQFSMDSRIILPCCLFIIYSSILLFQESYISFFNISGRLSAPERIVLSARVAITKCGLLLIFYCCYGSVRIPFVGKRGVMGDDLKEHICKVEGDGGCLEAMTRKEKQGGDEASW
nr:hypothetical protein [Tanacetum cinerariifolium]